MPATRRQATRQRRTHAAPASTSKTSTSLPKLTITSPRSQSSRITKSSKKMVSTRSSTRAAARQPALSASASPAATSRAPTFPELVRARVAYSPAPSHASTTSSSSAASVASPATVTAGPSSHAAPHWIQWPSQLAAASSSSAQASRASSLPTPHRFERGSSVAEQADLGQYAALLQGALLRKGRETTGSPA